MKAAIVAHFNPNNHLDSNFHIVLACLEQIFDVVVLVTTSDFPESETKQYAKLITIRRPNIGYDFYSYRVGIQYLKDHSIDAEILLINSSFFVIDKIKFTDTLKQMVYLGNQHNVVGVVDSNQISWHIQSFLVFFTNATTKAAWFTHFFDNVQPRNTKMEVILNYEIGLSSFIKANNVNAAVLFQPSFFQRMKAELRWMLRTNKKNWLNGVFDPHQSEINMSHFAADFIAQQFGFVKAEVVRTNPHRISTNFVQRLSSADVWRDINKSLANTSNNYKTGKDGLTSLVTKDDTGSGRLFVYGNQRAKGVRIAVVLHLFYVDLLSEILNYLKNIIEPFDLYITTPFEGDVGKIINISSVAAHSVTVYLTENYGRDIRPFMDLFRLGLLDDYQAVLKIHSKKSKYHESGTVWRQQLFDQIIGDAITTRRILHLFDNQNEQQKIGMLGPHSFYLSNDRFWGDNYSTSSDLLLSIQMIEQHEKIELGFFAGSMFWFAPKALKGLHDIDSNLLKFEPEKGQRDGTVAHAVERIFCIISRHAGYKVTTLPLAGKEIDDTDTSGNRVPVL